MYHSELVAEKEARSAAQQQADRILNQIIKPKNGWETEEVSSGVYSVSGYGLGYTDQMSFGKGYYYGDEKSIEPRSQEAMKLRNMITGRLDEQTAMMLGYHTLCSVQMHKVLGH